MLIICIKTLTIIYLAVVPCVSPIVNSVHYTRVSVMVAFICLALGTFLSVESVDIYHSLFNYSSFTIIRCSLLYMVIALAFNIHRSQSAVKAYACSNHFVIVKRVITFNDFFIFSAKNYITSIGWEKIEKYTNIISGADKFTLIGNMALTKVYQGVSINLTMATYLVNQTSIQKFAISCITSFFILDPNIILNCTELVALKNIELKWWSLSTTYPNLLSTPL